MTAATALFGQWSLSVSVPNPYPSPFVSDWQGTPGIVNIVVDYAGNTPATVKLDYVATCTQHGEIATGVISGITFNGPQTVSKDNTHFMSSQNVHFNDAYKTQIIQTGLLPEGDYVLDVKLEDISGGVLDQKSAPFHIIGFTVPALTTPQNNSQVAVPCPTFTWTPVTSHPGFSAKYTLRICEVFSGQTAEQAMNNVPFAGPEPEITNLTTHIYGGIPSFVSGRTYAWRIQARDQTGRALGSNEGKSQVFSFTWGATAQPFPVTGMHVKVPAAFRGTDLVSAWAVFDLVRDTQVSGDFRFEDNSTHFFRNISLRSPKDSVECPSVSWPEGMKQLGAHKLKVKVEDPVPTSGRKFEDSANYQIVTGVKLDSLELIPGVAKLFDFNTPQVIPEGQSSYTLTGLAKLRMISLKQTVDSCDVGNISITLAPGDPFHSQVGLNSTIMRNHWDGSRLLTVQSVVDVREVLYAAGPTPQLLLHDADLVIPKLNDTIKHIPDIVVGPQGIAGMAISTTKEISKWGFTFQIKGVTVNGCSKPAVYLTYFSEGSDAGLTLTLSGSLLFKRSRQPNDPITLCDFTGFTVSVDKNMHVAVSGAFDVTKPVNAFSGNKFVKLTKCVIKDTLPAGGENSLCFLVQGRLDSLPKVLGGVCTPVRTFSLLFDLQGNAVGDMAVLNELSTPGKRRKDGDENADPTEWSITRAKTTIDLTYLGFSLKFANGMFQEEQSWINFGVDVYLPLKDTSGGSQSDADCRVGLGDWDPGQNSFVGGLRINYQANCQIAGNASAQVIKDWCLDKPKVVKLKVRELAVRLDPFSVCVTCSLGLNLKQVTGGAVLNNATINPLASNDEEPFFSLGSVTDLALSVQDVFAVGCKTLAWGDRETTLTFQQNTGSSAQGATVKCSSFFLLENLTVAVGKTGDIASGGCTRFLAYDTRTASNDTLKKLTITNANLALACLKLYADIDYTSGGEGGLAVAGRVELPGTSKFQATLVGKIAKKDGEASVGLFVAANFPGIPIYPGVNLTGAGGGFFWNPEQTDLDGVVRMCKLQVPGSPAAQAQAATSQADCTAGRWALMLYGAVSIVSEGSCTGEALVTLTPQFFKLNAHVKVLPKVSGMLDGLCYLQAGWRPQFWAEGAVTVNLNVAKELVKGQASLDFYIYPQPDPAPTVWGINSTASATIAKIFNAACTLYVGPPGFLSSAGFGCEFKIKKVVEMGLDFYSMFWYQVGKSTGAYGKASADAKLFGVASVAIGLEGALVASGNDEFIYCVGDASFDVTVLKWSGSVWVAFSGNNGLDGGLGRNSNYDAALSEAMAQARAMQTAAQNAAAQLASAKDALDAAAAAVGAMMPEELAKAGLTLAEPTVMNSQYATLQSRYTALLGSYFQGQPGPLHGARDQMFNPCAESLAKRKFQLRPNGFVVQRLKGLNSAVAYQTAQLQSRIEAQSLALTGTLPTVHELGCLGSPFGGYSTQTVRVVRIVNGDTIKKDTTVTSGYAINAGQASMCSTAAGDVRSQNEQYREALMNLADSLDAKLRAVDRLLHRRETLGWNRELVPAQPIVSGTAVGLCTLYAAAHDELISVKSQLSMYLSRAAANASARKGWFDNARNSIVAEVDRLRGSGAAPDCYMTAAAEERALVRAVYGDNSWGEHRFDNLGNSTTAWAQECQALGKDLFYNLPKTGYESLVAQVPRRLDSVNVQFKASDVAFRSGWTELTRTVDGIYDRKARLYELLYDITDQLEENGELPGKPATRFYARSGGVLESMPARTGETLHCRSKPEIQSMLSIPRITQFTGTCTSDPNIDPYSAKLDLSCTAVHARGIADYSHWYEREGAQHGSGWSQPYRTSGPQRSASEVFTQSGNRDTAGSYSVYVRARGEGGYTIRRKGVVQVGFAGPGATQPLSHGVTSSDNTPPLPPVIYTDSVCRDRNLIFGKWLADDPESGIQSYRYRLQRLVVRGTPPRQFQELQELVPWTVVGGMTEVNIRGDTGLHLIHNDRCRLWVKAINGRLPPLACSSYKTIHIDTTDRTPPLPFAVDWNWDNVARTITFNWQVPRDSESEVKLCRYGMVRWLNGRLVTVVDTTPAVSPESSTVTLTPTQMARIGAGNYIFGVLATNSYNLTRLCATPVEVQPPRAPSLSLNAQAGVVSWSRPEDPKFGASWRYRLDKVLDNGGTQTTIDWTPTTGTSVNVMSSIGPGPYRFTLEVQNGFGLRTSSNREFTLIVQQPGGGGGR
jgi:hypothetical protein